MEKNKKKALQGMEHLKSELDESGNEFKTESNIEKSHSIIRSELVQILIIMILLFGSIAAIVAIDSNTDFLQNLAEKIDNWI